LYLNILPPLRLNNNSYLFFKTCFKLLNPIFKPSFMEPFRKKFYLLIGSEYLENIKLSKIFTKAQPAPAGKRHGPDRG